MSATDLCRPPGGNNVQTKTLSILKYLIQPTIYLHRFLAYGEQILGLVGHGLFPLGGVAVAEMPAVIKLLQCYDQFVVGGIFVAIDDLIKSQLGGILKASYGHPKQVLVGGEQLPLGLVVVDHPVEELVDALSTRHFCAKVIRKKNKETNVGYMTISYAQRLAFGVAQRRRLTFGHGRGGRGGSTGEHVEHRIETFKGVDVVIDNLHHRPFLRVLITSVRPHIVGLQLVVGEAAVLGGARFDVHVHLLSTRRIQLLIVGGRWWSLTKSTFFVEKYLMREKRPNEHFAVKTLNSRVRLR